MEYSTQGQSTQPVAKDTIAAMVNEMDLDIDRLEKLFAEMDRRQLLAVACLAARVRNTLG